jgi:hypothetical protein
MYVTHGAKKNAISIEIATAASRIIFFSGTSNFQEKCGDPFMLTRRPNLSAAFNVNH